MTTITRARTGCWTCRARRVKCDGQSFREIKSYQIHTKMIYYFLETHPICRRCARKNSPCGYGIRLVWHEESLARGVCHGRAGVWSKRVDFSRVREKNSPRQGTDSNNRETRQLKEAKCQSRTWMFLNTTMKDLEIHFDGGRIRCKSAMAQRRCESLNLGITTIPHDGRSNFDPILMSFFEQTICSSSTLVDNSLYNPYRYLILPMALESQGLYHATLAIAANTLKLSDTKYSLPALEHHSRALGHLRALLSHESWGEKELDEMLGLVLMLCWFDVGCPIFYLLSERLQELY